MPALPKRMFQLLSDWLIRQFLLFDAVLYGAVVRDCMANIDLHDFVDSGGIITMHAPISSMNYVERLIHEAIVGKIVNGNNLSETNVVYTCDHIDRKIKVLVTYYKCMQKELPCRNIDVNSLCLSRTGLGISAPTAFQPCIFQSHPSPLLTILEHCRNREFHLLNANCFDSEKVKEAEALIERGWHMLNGAVHVCEDLPSDDVCCICKSDFVHSCIRTRCGHTFHAECWTKYLKSVSAHVVACPMCRHEMDKWEALVPLKI